MATAGSPVPLGTILAGKYRVEEVLGRGGMGVVVAAWHLELEQRVALKFLSANLSDNPDAAERFRREARAAAKIKSEHVVRVLDVGLFNETMPFMVLEFLEGYDLDEELQRGGPLPVSIAVDYLLQAIEPLAEAHAAGIVHRDLKPSNLFLFRRPDGSKMIKVLDFGISKSLITAPSSSFQQMALTATASIIGSPLYMSPEQMQSPRSVDTRTDIWSLGAILYHLLVGEPPYLGENIAQLCQMLLNSQPAPLSRRRSDIPLELERIVFRCLEKNRDNRFSNVSELASALARFASEFSRVHVSRAQRILSSSNLDAHTTVQSGELPRDELATQSAWDREQTRRTPKRTLRWALPSLALLAAGLGAFFWNRTRPAPLGAPDVSAAAKLPVSPVHTVSPSPVEPAVITPPPPEQPPSPANAIVALPPAAPPSALPPPSATAPAPHRAAAPPVRNPASPPRTSKPALTNRPDSNDGLTDFGGRR